MAGSISQAIGRIADEIAGQFDGYHVIILAANPDTGHLATHASSPDINTPAEMIEALEMVTDMIRVARPAPTPAVAEEAKRCRDCGAEYVPGNPVTCPDCRSKKWREQVAAASVPQCPPGCQVHSACRATNEMIRLGKWAMTGAVPPYPAGDPPTAGEPKA